VPQEERQRVAVDLCGELGVGPQRLEFGSKRKRLPNASVVERLLSGPIAHEVQRARLAIPEREREHPVEAIERALETPCVDRGEHDLRIRAPTETVAQPAEILTQLEEVVDLAVVVDDVTPARRGHRLAPVSRKIDDRETAVAEP